MQGSETKSETRLMARLATAIGVPHMRLSMLASLTAAQLLSLPGSAANARLAAANSRRAANGQQFGDDRLGKLKREHRLQQLLVQVRQARITLIEQTRPTPTHEDLGISSPLHVRHEHLLA